MPSKVSFASRQSSKSGSETPADCRPSSSRVPRETMRPSSSPGSPVNRMAFATVYMAEVRAMPSPRTRTTPRVNPTLLDQQPPGEADVLQHALQPCGEFQTSRTWSRVSGRLPSARRAAAAAAARSSPRACSSCCFISRWNPQLVVELALVEIALKQVAQAPEEPGHAVRFLRRFSLPIV